jgi:quercetin dioxygenase-like cupin family protein
MASRVSLFRWDELELEKVTEMIARKVVVGDRNTVIQAYLKKGALVPVHTHPSEQLIYVLQGALRATVGEDVITVREGELLQVPSEAPHQVEVLDDTFVLDIRGTERQATD